MCNIMCANKKCDKRKANGYCGRAYPCSEFQTLQYDSLLATKLMEQGNVTPLKDLYRKFIATQDINHK